MLKVFFSLFICVLVHSALLENSGVYKEEADKDLSIYSSVGVLNQESDLYKKDPHQNFYNFPNPDDTILSQMNNSLLYVLVPVYNCADYIGEMVQSIGKAKNKLPSDCVVYPIFIIDDNEKDGKAEFDALKRAITQAHFENFDISFNPKNQGVDFTRRALLDKMIKINDAKYTEECKNTYFVFLDADDVINSSTFKVFLSIALLNKDIYMFDFEYCLRYFQVSDKSQVVLDTDLTLADFCYRYYEQPKSFGDDNGDDCNILRHFDKENHFFKKESFDIICGYCPALYKYDKKRVEKCKDTLDEYTLEHFCPAYVTTDASISDSYFPIGYFAVFLKGFTLSAKERAKKDALYYYRDWSDSEGEKSF